MESRASLRLLVNHLFPENAQESPTTGVLRRCLYAVIGLSPMVFATSIEWVAATFTLTTAEIRKNHKTHINNTACVFWYDIMYICLVYTLSSDTFPSSTPGQIRMLVADCRSRSFERRSPKREMLMSHISHLFMTQEATSSNAPYY